MENVWGTAQDEGNSSLLPFLPSFFFSFLPFLLLFPLSAPKRFANLQHGKIAPLHWLVEVGETSFKQSGLDVESEIFKMCFQILYVSTQTVYKQRKGT